MPRTWQRRRHAPVLALPPLPAPAQDLLDTFAAAYPRAWLVGKRNMPGGAAVVVHTLPARLGPHADPRAGCTFPGRNRCGRHRCHAPCDLHAHALLTDVQHQVLLHVPDLSQEGRDRHDEKALHTRISASAPMADQLSAWVRVMRGRYRHAPAGFRRVRRHLCIAWPTLTARTVAGLDLRQITADHITSELARHQGNVARGLLSVLRSIFRALKQERFYLAPRPGCSCPLEYACRGSCPAIDWPGPWTGWMVPPRDSSSVVAIHAVRAVEVARLDLADADLARRTPAVRRGKGIHLVHLDGLSTGLAADWLRERRRRPQAINGRSAAQPLRDAGRVRPDRAAATAGMG
jgi:hypothetical protein